MTLRPSPEAEDAQPPGPVAPGTGRAGRVRRGPGRAGRARRGPGRAGQAESGGPGRSWAGSSWAGSELGGFVVGRLRLGGEPAHREQAASGAGAGQGGASWGLTRWSRHRGAALMRKLRARPAPAAYPARAAHRGGLSWRPRVSAVAGLPADGIPSARTAPTFRGTCWPRSSESPRSASCTCRCAVALARGGVRGPAGPRPVLHRAVRPGARTPAWSPPGVYLHLASVAAETLGQRGPSCSLRSGSLWNSSGCCWNGGVRIVPARLAGRVHRRPGQRRRVGRRHHLDHRGLPGRTSSQ